MDFLKTGLYKKESDDSAAELLGVVLTRFDPTVITSRSYSEYMDAGTLRGGIDDGSIMPSGFNLDDSGNLFSDTVSQFILRSEDHKNYIIDEFVQNDKNKKSLLDVVLFGASTNSKICVNYDEVSEEVPPIIVDMKNLRVSGSSFNIFAPYVNEDNEFRTLSLVDIESVQAIKFVMCVSREETQIPGWLYTVATKTQSTKPGLAEFVTLEVDAPLVGSTVYCGEAFANYLAYYASYYNIAIAILDEYINSCNPTSSSVNKSSYSSYPRKKQEINVNIVSDLKRHKIKEVLEYGSNPDALSALVSHSEEARVTYMWLQYILKISNEVGDNIVQTCTALKADCLLHRLHYSIELLAQRIYLASFYPNVDPMPSVVRGGGVHGTALKECHW